MSRARARLKGVTTFGSIAVAAFMVFVLSCSSVVAAAPPGAVAASATAGTVWAYGWVKTVDVGPHTTPDGWSYEGSATIGYAVVLNETNTSSTTFGISVERTMGVLFSLVFCKPNCGLPVASAGITYHAWETTDAFANFTTEGSVLEGNLAVRAVALLDSSSSVQANLIESTHSAIPQGGVLVDRSKSLNATVAVQTAVTFGTPLGLFPVQLVAPTSWSSTSAFVATGAAQYVYSYSIHAPSKNVIVGPVTGALMVNPVGNVTVDGSYASGHNIVFGGISYPVILLTVEGPFSVREGFILVPSDADLFSSTTLPWAANQSGAATAQMTSLDARASTNGHLGVAASSWLYDSVTLNPASALPMTVGVVDLSPAVTSGVNPVASTSIQGTPENVGAAQSEQNCLATGVGCPGPATPGIPHALLVAAGFGVVIVAVLAVIATVLAVERRRPPAPVFPNANLYPPGANGMQTAGPSTRPPPTPPPPSEEDPLDHLW